MILNDVIHLVKYICMAQTNISPCKLFTDVCYQLAITLMKYTGRLYAIVTIAQIELRMIGQYAVSYRWSLSIFTKDHCPGKLPWDLPQPFKWTITQAWWFARSATFAMINGGAPSQELIFVILMKHHSIKEEGEINLFNYLYGCYNFLMAYSVPHELPLITFSLQRILSSPFQCWPQSSSCWMQVIFFLIQREFMY